MARHPNGRKVRELKKNLHGVDLPTGTDPETRRQRRLMRNRLTAQASRDRKRLAIEESRRERDEREVEIEGLRRTIRDVSFLFFAGEILSFLSPLFFDPRGAGLLPVL